MRIALHIPEKQVLVRGKGGRGRCEENGPEIAFMDSENSSKTVIPPTGSSHRAWKVSRVRNARFTGSDNKLIATFAVKCCCRPCAGQFQSKSKMICTFSRPFGRNPLGLGITGEPENPEPRRLRQPTNAGLASRGVFTAYVPEGLMH